MEQEPTRSRTPTGFVDLPYENDSGMTYRVYLGLTSYVTDIGIGSNGNRGYSKKVDAVGFAVAPDSVVDTGTELRLLIDGNLTALGMPNWLTSNTEDASWSYDCVVFLDTDVTGVEIATNDPDDAIVFGKLTKVAVGTGWVIDLTGLGDGYLGQATPSTTAGDYKIVILGPLITTTDLDADPDWTHVGTVLSGAGEVIDTSGQRIVADASTSVTAVEDAMDKILTKGWTVLPTVTATAGSATITIGPAAEVFTQGKLSPGILGTVLGALPAASDVYVSYDPGTNTYVLNTTWDAADAADLVPIMAGETDGGSLLLWGESVGQKLNQFPERVMMTLSGRSDPWPGVLQVRGRTR